MRNRLFGACIVSATLASLAAAQGPPVVPPSPAPPPIAQSMSSAVPQVVMPADAGPMMPTSAVGPADAFGPFQAAEYAQPAAAPDTPPVMPPHADTAPHAHAGRYWIDNEFLMWWMQGTRLLPLVGTSPAGTPQGVITAASTTIYGPGSEDNNLRLGYRLTGGGWIDDEHKYAVEAQFLMFANGGNQFNAFSPGTPILFRPIIIAGLGPIPEPIAQPGVSNGSIHVATSTSGWVGGGVWVRENFSRTDDPCDTCHCCRGGGCCGGCADLNSPWYCRFDSLIGYRYLRLSDRLEIDDTVNAVVALNGLPAGSTLSRFDLFHTANTFHGVDLGITGEALAGPWSIGMLAKVAVGFNDNSVDISGIHMLNNGPARVGGLLAQTSNIGHYSRVIASGVPELGLRLGYSIRPNAKVFVGYSLLYWYHVARAANEVNPIVDASFALGGGPTVGNPISPGFALQDRSIWVTGVRVGFEWTY
jgi:hypothetical protein